MCQRTCSRSSVQDDARRVLPSAEAPLGWRHQCRQDLIAAYDDKSCRDVARVVPPKERAVSFEEGPEAAPGSEPFIIEQERGSRGSVCAHDALVMVDGQQHSRAAMFG